MTLAVAGTVASAAGGLVNASQKASYDRKVRASEMAAYERSRDARLAEQERQKAFENQANDFWSQTADQLSAGQMATDQQAAETGLAETVQNLPNGTPEGFLLSGQDNASDEVKTEIARRTSEAAAEARKRVAALAKLSGQDNVGADRAMTLNTGTDFLSMLNGLRRGSLGVSQFEQTIPAEYVSPPDSLFADILSGAGATMTGGARPGGIFNPTGLY